MSVMRTGAEVRFRLPDFCEIGYPRNIIRRVDDDLKRTLLTFLQVRAGGGVRFTGAIGELKRDWAATLNLEAVVKLRPRSQRASAEACAGVVDFEKRNPRSTIVCDRCGYKCGATPARKY